MRLRLADLRVFVSLRGGRLRAKHYRGASELLARGAQLISSKPAEAVKLLQQALRLDPELPALQYQLGLAFHAIGDEADAEAELREAVRRTPDSAAAHNYLGSCCFRWETRRPLWRSFAPPQSSPRKIRTRISIWARRWRAPVTARGAVEELRVAAGLAPSDAGLARLLKAVETARRRPESTIKVEVRQVLVPVVVTDREGHHVTGLTQADFQVFEDGVEQKITAFSVEKLGRTAGGNSGEERGFAGGCRGSVGDTPAASSAQLRRTYMILIDTLHTSFNNFVSAREALVKLFQQEHSADSQYVVVALAASPEMVLNVTPDASAVLAVFQNKRFQKIFLDGQKGGLKAEMERFRRDLTETRYACDLANMDNVFKIKCAAGIRRAPQQAQANRGAGPGADCRIPAAVPLSGGPTGASPRPAHHRADFGRFQMCLAMKLCFGECIFPPASHCLAPVDVFCPPNGLQPRSRMAEEFEPILNSPPPSNVTIDTIDSRGLYGQRAFDASNPGTPVSIDGAVGRSREIGPRRPAILWPKSRRRRAARLFTTTTICWAACSAPSPMAGTITPSRTFRAMRTWTGNFVRSRLRCAIQSGGECQARLLGAGRPVTRFRAGYSVSYRLSRP